MLTCISIYGYEGIFGQSVTVDAKNGEFSSGKSCGPSDFHIAECAWNVQERISGLRNFLDASSHLYKRVCPSVGPSVGPSVRRSVGMSRFCKKCMKLRVLCTEMIKKAYKVMNNIKTAL